MVSQRRCVTRKHYEGRLLTESCRNQGVSFVVTSVSSCLRTLSCTTSVLQRITLLKRKIPRSLTFLYGVWTSKNVRTRLTYLNNDIEVIRFTDIDVPPDHQPFLYDLVANVVLDSVAGTARDKEHTVWKVHLRAGGGGGDSEKWFQLQDLIVEEIQKEMIFLGESMLQVRVFLPNQKVNNSNCHDVF
jgi:hypothetical protein